MQEQQQASAKSHPGLDSSLHRPADGGYCQRKDKDVHNRQ